MLPSRRATSNGLDEMFIRPDSRASLWLPLRFAFSGKSLIFHERIDVGWDVTSNVLIYCPSTSISPRHCAHETMFSKLFGPQHSAERTNKQVRQATQFVISKKILPKDRWRILILMKALTSLIISNLTFLEHLSIYEWIHVDKKNRESYYRVKDCDSRASSFGSWSRYPKVI